jgi:hypothetical protein
MQTTTTTKMQNAKLSILAEHKREKKKIFS